MRRGSSLIIIVVLIAVLSVGGLLYYAIKSTPTLSPSNSPAASVSLSPSVSSTPQTSAYLLFTEWGVKLALSSGINDIRYTYDKASDRATITSTALLAEMSKSDPALECSLGWIQRSKTAFPAEASKPAPADRKLIDSDYYGYFTPDVACPGGAVPNADALARVSAAQTPLVQAAFQTLQANQ